MTGPLPLGRKVASSETLLPGEAPEIADCPRLFADPLAAFVSRAEGFDPQPLLRPAPAWVHRCHKEDGAWSVPDDQDVDLKAERCSATAWVDELGVALRERLEVVSPSAVGPNTAPTRARVPVSTSVINSSVGQP